MIQSFSISNYRSFKERAVFTFEPNTYKEKSRNLHFIESNSNTQTPLLKYSLIHGANGSGKTNLMRFMYIFVRELCNLQPIELMPLYDPYKFDDKFANGDASFKIVFYIDKALYSYEFIHNSSGIKEEKLCSVSGSDSKIIFERQNDIENEKSTIIICTKDNKLIKDSSFAYQRNSLILKSFVKDYHHEKITPAAKYLSKIITINGYNDNMLKDMLGEVTEWIESSRENMLKLTEIVKMCDTGIHSFRINQEKKAPHARLEIFHRDEQAECYRIDYYDQSHGTRLILLITGMILKAISLGTPIFIDEMDSGLHFYITRWILEFFTSSKINNTSQLLMTSHDIHLLDESTIRKDQVWFTEKNEKGESELFSLSDFTDVEEHTPFAKWYVHNKFGATPSLGAVEDLFKQKLQ